MEAAGLVAVLHRAHTASTGGDAPPECLVCLGWRLTRREHPAMAVQKLTLRPAGDPQQVLVGVFDAALGAGDDDRDGALLHHLRQQPQAHGGCRLLRDVGAAAAVAEEAPSVV